MPIGSVTKSFTAIAIGELVAEGKMDWDTTPVNTYLPEFELKDPVLIPQLTLVDLLSHRTVFLYPVFIFYAPIEKKPDARKNVEVNLFVFFFLVSVRTFRACF